MSIFSARFRVFTTLTASFAVTAGVPVRADPWTVVNLHPAGATTSSACSVCGSQQVGWASIGGVGRASLWSGTAASWVDGVLARKKGLGF